MPSKRYLQPGQQLGEIPLQDMFARIGEEVVQAIRVELARVGLVPSRLATSTQFKAAATQVAVLMADYYRFVESGRKPGSRMPPEAPILAWMKREGIARGRENEILYAIRKSIAIKGIRPRPFLLRAVREAGANRIPQVFRFEVAAIGEEYAQNLKDTLQK